MTKKNAYGKIVIVIYSCDFAHRRCQEGRIFMKKLICIIFSLCLLLSTILPLSSLAATAQEPTYRYILTIDGQETKEVRKGETIRVTLELERVGSSDPYDMYGMQAELRYDTDFFELVEEGTALAEGIRSTDISVGNGYREFYMNYVNGTRNNSTDNVATGDSSSSTAYDTGKWTSKKMIGSFELRVIAETGTTKITNEDFLVCYQNGMGSGYACTSNELTITVTQRCDVTFESNGGSAVAAQTLQSGDKIVEPIHPTKDGFVFGGWYKDPNLTRAWNFATDTVSDDTTLYAKWITPPDEPVVPPTGDAMSQMMWITLLSALLAVTLFLILFVIGRRRAEDRR